MDECCQNRLFKTGNSVHLFRLDDSRFYLLADSVYLYDQSVNKLVTIQNQDTGQTVSSLTLIAKDKNVSYCAEEMLYLN